MCKTSRKGQSSCLLRGLMQHSAELCSSGSEAWGTVKESTPGSRKNPLLHLHMYIVTLQKQPTLRQDSIRCVNPIFSQHLLVVTADIARSSDRSVQSHKGNTYKKTLSLGPKTPHYKFMNWSELGPLFWIIWKWSSSVEWFKGTSYLFFVCWMGFCWRGLRSKRKGKGTKSWSNQYEIIYKHISVIQLRVG